MAGKGFTSTIDLSSALKGITKGADKGVKLAVNHLLTEANKGIPHDEGTLERSGRATTSGRKGAVSYNTPYAVRQHEDMELRHDGKGKAKWLEVTMAEEAGTVGKIIAQAIKSEVGK